MIVAAGNWRLVICGTFAIRERSMVNKKWTFRERFCEHVSQRQYAVRTVTANDIGDGRRVSNSPHASALGNTVPAVLPVACIRSRPVAGEDAQGT
ncbi:hypothetical protein [Microbaculum marinum]|uniref:Uncharacterized protein n=1 Tax=Microbaculum marinum TaxID=1764581 RepID=A0AAW9RD47_9HYPH